MELEIKPGAQVIFIKNDKEKRWVNGTLGVVIYIDEGEGIITVVDEDGHEYDVEREVWENMRYTFNEKEQKIEEEMLGSFIQFPLRLAWAITVHKSQGLTFRHVKIDFSGGGAFAGGQTYVALSRCTSLEGITLEAPIRRSDIFVRAEVVAFANRYNDGQLIKQAMLPNGLFAGSWVLSPSCNNNVSNWKTVFVKKRKRSNDWLPNTFCWDVNANTSTCLKPLFAIMRKHWNSILTLWKPNVALRN